MGVTAPKTMKVLPQTKKGTQKVTLCITTNTKKNHRILQVTIGDISGVLMCFGAKKGDVNVSDLSYSISVI